MATRRPPSARRASADEMCRSAASATRPSTWAATENGGFISTTRRTHGCVEMIVDVGRVVPGDGDPGEQSSRADAARVSASSFRAEPAAGEFGMDGEEPGAGRGLQHDVGGRDRRGRARDEAELDRRGELLERLALFGAARMGRNERRQLGQHAEERGWRGSSLAHGPARTCAGTGSAPPRRRRRRSSRSRRPRHRRRRKPLSSRREAHVHQLTGRVRGRRGATRRPRKEQRRHPKVNRRARQAWQPPSRPQDRTSSS